MKPGLTAGAGNTQGKGRTHGKPKRVGTAHNKDKGARHRKQQRELEAHRREFLPTPDLDGSKLTDVERDSFKRGISLEAIRRARAANEGIDTSKFKMKKRKRR